jgi:RNA methyltransferase, TrmH family
MASKHITSRDNSVFKQLKKLVESARERRAASQAVLDGAHLVGAYIEAFGEPELLIFAEGDCTEDVVELLDRFEDAEKMMLPPAMFAEISPVATPTGLLALVATPNIAPPVKPQFALLLENIQDPGNLGGMLRSAAAAGVEVAYLSEGCADAWSPKTLRGGQGAHFVLPIVERADLLKVMTGFAGQTLAAEMHGQSLYGLDLTGPVAFLIGNEGAGLSETLASAASQRVAIPMPGKVESLNAAAAAAICLFERVRQKG